MSTQNWHKINVIEHWVVQKLIKVYIIGIFIYAHINYRIMHIRARYHWAKRNTVSSNTHRTLKTLESFTAVYNPRAGLVPR
jgi:hypothetical protein